MHMATMLSEYKMRPKCDIFPCHFEIKMFPAENIKTENISSHI